MLFTRALCVFAALVGGHVYVCVHAVMETALATSATDLNPTRYKARPLYCTYFLHHC